MHSALACMLATDRPRRACLSLLQAACPSSASSYGALTSCPLLSLIPSSKCVFPPPRKQHIARGGLHDLPLQHFSMPSRSEGSAACPGPLRRLGRLYSTLAAA